MAPKPGWQVAPGQLAAPHLGLSRGGHRTRAMNCELNPVAGHPARSHGLAAAIGACSRGFFLMIESASIDKQSHERNPCGSIGEIEQLEETIALAMVPTATDATIIVTAITRRPRGFCRAFALCPPSSSPGGRHVRTGGRNAWS